MSPSHLPINPSPPCAPLAHPCPSSTYNSLMSTIPHTLPAPRTPKAPCLLFLVPPSPVIDAISALTPAATCPDQPLTTPFPPSIGLLFFFCFPAEASRSNEWAIRNRGGSSCRTDNCLLIDRAADSGNEYNSPPGEDDSAVEFCWGVWRFRPEIEKQQAPLLLWLGVYRF